MADIERSVEIEQIDYNVDINNVSYSIDILPQNTYTIELNKQGPQGLRGYNGNGIESYVKTSSSGLTDIYTITFTDGDTTTVNVTNGRSITSINGPVSVGNIDTYTINYNDNTTSTFTVTNGIDGINPTVTVGTTTTGNPGTNASVINSGTIQDIVLDFTIPRGDKGETGEDGADGYSPIATVSKVGDTATISITDINGTTTTTISDGVDGIDGQDGEAATISVGTVTTGLPTDPASVTNVGTTSNAIFDFTIPKGDTGDTGATGNGIASITKTGTVGLVDTYTILYTDGTSTTFTVTNGANGTGSVADVLVNGTSVLDGNIAKVIVPTDNLQLTNGAGYITSSALTPYVLSSSLATVATTGAYSDLIGTPTIPTKISDLTDDTSTTPIDKAESVVDNNSGSLTFWSGTKAQYDAIVTKDADTLYNITDDNTADAYQAYTKSEVDTLITNALNDALYYKAGDTIDWSNLDNNITVSGVLTATQKAITFTIPLPKRLDNVFSANLSNLVLNIRKPSGGYLPSAAGYTPLTDATATVTCSFANGNLLAISINRTDAFSEINNVPLSISINTISLTFS